MPYAKHDRAPGYYRGTVILMNALIIKKQIEINVIFMHLFVFLLINVNREIK